MSRAIPSLLVVAVLSLAACGSGNSPTPSPPGNPGGESITGRERIGWDQTAGGAADLMSLRFAIYVDGVRSEMTDVSCASIAGAAGFACSGRLPAMSAGSHVLEIAAFTASGGIVESARSAPLRVTVTGATAPVDFEPLVSGEQVTTADGISLVATTVTDSISDPTDLALAADGRIFITEADGRLSVVTDGAARELLRVPESEGQGGLLSVALSPDFAASGHVFVIAAVASESGALFRVLRYRLVGDRAEERAAVLADVPASTERAALIRVGVDGKLYVALDAGGSDDRAHNLSEWGGKILRIELDGRTPPDQPAASPVFWSGIRTPGGLDWTAGGLLWAAESGTDGVERLRAIGVPGDRPLRPEARTTYALPVPFGGRSLAVYSHDRIPEFAQDLFLAGREANYLLRISLDPDDRSRAIRTERMLEDRLQTVRAVAVSRDGSLYICTADALWRLTASERLRDPVSR